MSNAYGYKGAGKNRRLSPEQVTMIRKAVWAGERSTAYFARVFGVGVESIRRVVRGETYPDVGWRPPDWDEGEGMAPRYAPTPDPLEKAAAESLLKVQRMLAEAPPPTEPAPEKVDIGKLLHGFDAPGVEPDKQTESALDRFIRETKAAKAASPDALLEELKTAAPTDSGTEAGNARE